MSDKWIGCSVAIECVDSLGSYQGKVIRITDNTLTLARAFRNGLPYPRPEVTLKSNDIVNLEIIEFPNNENEHDTKISVIKVAKPIAKKPTNITPEPTKINLENSTLSPKHTSEKSDFVPYRRSLSTKKKCRDEICFGETLNLDKLNKDFDFEKNLALFDKKAIWTEINSQQKPDILKQTPYHDKLKLRDPNYVEKYKSDENILPTQPAVFRGIKLKKNSSKENVEYITDSGLIVPSINEEWRNQLWKICDKHKLNWERRRELFGRCVTEMSLQLLGGNYRFNPYNDHQAPKVVCICGPNTQGAMALNAACQLCTQGVKVITYLMLGDNYTPEILRPEIQYFLLTEQKLIVKALELPDPSEIDLIIIGMNDQEHKFQSYSCLVNWLKQTRVPILAIDPPRNGLSGIDIKFSLVPALPLCYNLSNTGKLFLCNVGIPDSIFNEIGICYKSPFAAKFLIPLNQNKL